MNVYDWDMKDTGHGFLILNVDKMSRLFFRDAVGEKVFSIHFPFFTQAISEAIDSPLEFTAKNGEVLDERCTSDLISVFSSGHGLFDEDEYFDAVSDGSSHRKELKDILMDLLSYESGYIRFDQDPANEAGNRHPLNHIDVFYSQSTTFKLGLDKKPRFDEITDILDRNTDCYFLRK